MKRFFILCLLFTFLPKIKAQIVDPFSIRYQINQKGGLVFLANTSVGCSCSANNEMPPNGTGDNNGFNMNFVDVDSDPSTYMSSRDQLNLPNCSEVVWAGLYWDAILNDIPSNTANFVNRNKVKLSVNGGTYQNLTADELLDNSTGKISYFCFKDITSIVQANPINASYQVANVVTETGMNTFGGWTIVVVYRNVYESMKNLTVFDGLANVSSGSGTVNININGFLTPPSGAVNFELGVVAHDGDRGQTGDQLEFNGAGSFVTISDALHTADNAFNSTISRNGVLTPLRNPSYNNNLGHDANIYSPNNSSFNFIGNSATSAQIRVSTLSETILTSVITSAIDIYEPDLRASVTYTDLNSGTVQPGDVLEYSITAKNIGSDVSINTILTDTLDPRLTYLPGTLQITYGPNSGVKTDATDSDQAEFLLADNVIRARIGTGANGASGGSVVNSPTGADSTVIKFRVRLSTDCAVWQCGDELENKAFLFGTGQISGITNGNNGLSDLLDEDGCPSPESGIINVDVNSCPDLAITYTDTLCVGETISLSFPNSPSLTLSWTGPNNFSSTLPNPTVTNAQITNSGEYVLHVSYNGEACVDDTIAPVFVSSNPTVQLLEIVNDTCYHAGGGSIRVDGVGNGPFTYSWSNNDADSLAQNVMAGNYTVTVTDRFGCDVTGTYTVTEPPIFEVTASITSNYNGEDVSCFNATDGSANAVANGGVGPYTYEWIPSGANTPNVSSIGAGQHIIEVTDNQGCIAKDTVQLTQPTALSVTATVTNVLCFGNTTGAINATVSGGTLPYTYHWSNGSLTEDLINIAAGTYTDTVTDVNGCSVHQSFTITQPTASMSLSATSSTILCHGDQTASIDLSVSGGSEPYDFSWSNGPVTEDLSNIGAGTYTVTVTDNNSCVQTLTRTLTEPSAISLNAVTTNPVCQNDSRGSIDLQASGGNPGYSFQWNNSEITEDISELYAGMYTVQVTDQNDCVQTLQVTLSDPDAVNIASSQVEVLCYGASTGAIDITPSNGNTPYNFDWSNNSISEDLTSIPAGDYYVNVTDVNGCGGFKAFTITQPDTLLYISSSTVTDVLCFNGADGSVSITVAGGTLDYDYAWSNSQQTPTINSLTAGNYSVTITDANNCQLIQSFVVDQPEALQATETHQDVLCFGGNTGSIDVSVTGGTQAYDYVWTNSAQTEDVSSLIAGDYGVTITDAHNCQTQLNVTILQPQAALSLSATSTPVLCFGGNTGTIDLTVNGGTPQYSFDWANATDVEDPVDLNAAAHFVTVTDENGCTDTLTVIVSQPAAPLSLTTTGSAICLGAADGIVSVSVSGGTPNYSYSWENSTTDTLSVLSNRLVGSYSVVVTDANGCTATATATVDQPEDLPGCVSLVMPNIFTPEGDQVNDFFIPAKAFNIADYHIIIVNRWGNVVYEGSDLVQGWDGKIDGKEASEGVYFWKVDFTDSYENKGTMHGNLTLIRD